MGGPDCPERPAAMRVFRIDLVQWAAGTILLFTSVVMLVVPHQLARSAAFTAVQAYAPWLGLLFLLAGGGLIATVMIPLPRRHIITAHLFAGATMLLLVPSLADARAWPKLIVFGVLGLGLLVAPWLAAPKQRAGHETRHLF